MKLKDYLKKRIMFFIFTIFLVVISVGTVSYSLNQNNLEKYIDKNEHINVEYLSGNKEIEVSHYPIANDVGSIYAPENKIKITNVSDALVNYEIVIKPSEYNELKDLSIIYLSINGEEAVSLNSLKNGVIKSSFLNGLSEEVFDIKIWPSKEHFNNNYNGNNVGLNLSIIEK